MFKTVCTPKLTSLTQDYSRYHRITLSTPGLFSVPQDSWITNTLSALGLITVPQDYSWHPNANHRPTLQLIMDDSIPGTEEVVSLSYFETTLPTTTPASKSTNDIPVRICKAGHQLVDGDCAPCPVKTYKEGEGGAQCTACPKDTTTSGTGSTSATDCLGRTFFLTYQKKIFNF